MSKPQGHAPRADVLAAAMAELQRQAARDDGPFIGEATTEGAVNIEGAVNLAAVLQAAIAAFVADDLR